MAGNQFESMETFEVEDDVPLNPSGIFERPWPAEPGKQRGGVKPEAKVMRLFIGILSVLVAIVVVALLITNTGKHESRDASTAAHTGTTFESGFNMKQNWGSFSPYFDSGVPFEGIGHSAPYGDQPFAQTCRLKQVHVLHRHGDRYPTEGVAQRMREVATKLQNMNQKPSQENLVWLSHWKFELGEELLVGSGVGALHKSGAQFWGSHGRHLYPNTSREVKWLNKFNRNNDGTLRAKPLLRATDQDRIQDSANAWAAGVFGSEPGSYELMLMGEHDGSNNSLASYYSCPNSVVDGAQTSDERAAIWTDIYLVDAATRIQKLLPGYDSLTSSEALEMQHLCVFETAAFGKSGFCGWFTEFEWRGFEYLADLKFYGHSGWGSHITPATGIPWLTELRARLTNKLITEPLNGVNTTITSDPKLFPLDQPFYADFTHDSVIVAVLSALQFPFTKPDLSPYEIKVRRQFIISRLTPFAARLYVEILECGEGGNSGEYVRLILNGRELPASTLKYCEDDDEKSGLCTLKGFTRTLDWALKQVDFEDICYGDHKYKPYDP